MGLPAQDTITVPLPKQQKNWIYSQINEKIIYTVWNGCFLDHDKFCHALLQYRNTFSRKDELSPAQKLYGSPTQDTLPAHRHSFSQEWQRQVDEVEQQVKIIQESITTYYNAHAHPLTEIGIGSNVAIQHPCTKLWDIYGIVTQISPNRRYYIKTSSGHVLVRNRRFLCHQVPLSIPAPSRNLQLDTPTEPTAHQSTCHKHPPRHLIEDLTWNWHNFYA